jgi:hypothetical protein
MGATLSGLHVASAVLSCGPEELLRTSGPTLRIYQSEDMSTWPADQHPRIAANWRLDARHPPRAAIG